MTDARDQDGPPGTARMLIGDCLTLLPAVPAASVDAVLCDPPYAEVTRSYGRLTEQEWHRFMAALVGECRRVLRPAGSALFILQPNSAAAGRLRTWLWEFLAWVGRTWGVVQDAYWWNYTALPVGSCHRRGGLLRPSVKVLAWCGPPDCYRDQAAVLWEPSQRTFEVSAEERALRRGPSGRPVRRGRVVATVQERGGTTPFNLLPVANNNNRSGHPAATPVALCDWWVRYLCPPGGLVLDPCAGTASVGVAALACGRRFLGIERDARYLEKARARLGLATEGRP